MSNQKQKLWNWVMVYCSIMVFGIITIETSNHPFTAFPAILITLTAMIMSFRFIGKFNKQEKLEKQEELQREIDEQERRARVKSFYKK